MSKPLTSFYLGLLLVALGIVAFAAYQLALAHGYHIGVWVLMFGEAATYSVLVADQIVWMRKHLR